MKKPRFLMHYNRRKYMFVVGSLDFILKIVRWLSCVILLLLHSYWLIVWGDNIIRQWTYQIEMWFYFSDKGNILNCCCTLFNYRYLFDCDWMGSFLKLKVTGLNCYLIADLKITCWSTDKYIYGGYEVLV